MTHVVALVGSAGGVGVSSVTAQCAAALTESKHACLAIDMSPDNCLRLHFGMAWDDDAGWARALLAGNGWHTAAYRSDSGVKFLPFGRLDGDAELGRLQQGVGARPDWFGAALSRVELASEAIVLCDCPRGDAALRAQVCSVADLILVVMGPEPVSYAHALGMLRRAERGGPDVAIILNGFDPARALDRDMLAMLRENAASHLAPLPIHRDESIREAHACKRAIFDYAPHSQGAYDIALLATWLIARLHQKHVPQPLEAQRA